MKIILLSILILLNIGVVKSQNLIVGFGDPNEILNLNSGSFSYDTVFLFNNATLNIGNQTQFVVKDIIATLGTSKLNVENSYFEVNKIFSTQDSSSVNLKDSLTLACNFYISENSFFAVDSAIVTIPMSYKGEFNWFGFNNSTCQITNSNINLGMGALGGRFSDSTRFTQLNNQFVSTILPMTLSLTGNSVTSIDSCSGGMEFVIAENADVTIQNSIFFMIWYTFADGDTANYDYPPSNSILIPGASHITGNYQFSDALPNVSDLDLNVSIQNTDGVFWGIISKKNSAVTVNNSSILACGFYFDGTSSDTASGFIDAQLYSSYSSPFLDRTFSLNNSSVNAWNFYSSDTSEVIIENCVYGESIGFLNGITKVYNSTCDGTGGYFGGKHNSKTYVYSSQIIRQNGTAQIINFQDSSKSWFYDSNIIGDIVLSGNSQLFMGNTTFSSDPITNQNAYFAESWMDSINNAVINSSVNITGKVWDINGAINNSKITRYTVAYSSVDSTGFTLIKDTSALSFNIINSQLANWNTQGLSVGHYLLWLTIFVDGDTAISCNRSVVLDHSTSIENGTITETIDLYPNPTSGVFTVEGIDSADIKIFDSRGKVIYEGVTSSINLKGHGEGIYFVKIKTKKGVLIKKIVLF
jgi:hypothetical protein